jgi:hypothetical protein
VLKCSSCRSVLVRPVRLMWQPSTEEGEDVTIAKRATIKSDRQSDHQERQRRSTAPVGAVELP